MERRLSAIFAADMVGYSRLMEADEIGTIERQKSHRRELIDPAFDEFHGRIFKEMGDGILVEFPSVVEAVSCALTIQRAMPDRETAVPEDRRITYRVGINLGDVIVEDDDVIGDGVNVAARLEQLSEPGGICISGTAYDQIEGRPEFSCSFLGEQNLKNISRPIRAYLVAFGGDRGETVGTSALALPDKPSIAVLPFDNLSGDPEQEFFSEGMAEEIITALSRYRWFFVIARNSSFIYKGHLVDVAKVAKELGVRYVLKGSVRKSGNRVRVSIHLIDAVNERQIWAERYDRELSNFFDLQDEITQLVASAIEPQLLTAEGTRTQSRFAANLGAWELVAKASAIFWRMTKADTDDAIAMLNEAVRRYPNYSPAHSMFAFMTLIVRQIGWSNAATTDLDVLEAFSRRAVELDGTDPWAHLAIGQFAVVRKQTQAAVFAFERALQLNPNFATAHGRLGSALALDGQSVRALEHLNYAMRLSPHDPQNAFLYGYAAMAHYLAEHYPEAISYAGKAIQLRPGVLGAHRILCASLAQAGHMEDARSAVQQLKRLQPDISINWAERTSALTPAPMQRFIQGLRKAGLPE